MILVILAVLIVVFVVGLIMAHGYKCEDLGAIMAIISGIMLIVVIIATICLTNSVIQANVIDDKISMYEEENTIIEQQISGVVKQYQEYETEIFANAKPEDSMAMISLYPELKSDTLVQNQITVYTQNNQKIKELKESKISADVYRWWLYFGSIGE